MSLNNFKKLVISIVSVTSMTASIASAQLVPGPGHGNGGGGRPPQYDPCSVPSDPNCHGGGGHGGGGYPGRPDPRPGDGGNHGGGYPGNPYPGYPPPERPRPPRPQPPPQRPDPGYPGDPYPGYPGNGGGYPGNPYPGNPYPTPPPQQQNVIRRVGLYRSVMNQTIDLRQLAGLDSRYAGYRIVSVGASTTPNSPYRTVAQLIVNGYNYAEEVNPGYEIFLAPYQVVRLDRFGTNVGLRILGSTYINEIQIELSRY